MADYSALDKFLHRLALGTPAIAEMLHDLERGLYLKSSPPAAQSQHVFVTGLARAGSTILMREIYATHQFGSLTYADMPFVLAPNLWSRLARAKKPQGRAERAHGDGIVVDVNSPEALDEVYWRLFCATDYIAPDGLSPHDPDQDRIDGYIDLIRLILRRTGKLRYLAKNNNNILRLRPLARALPASLFLVPMRAPLQHAQSLLAQHRRFLTPDPFTAQYMTWLAHHEFGATHRPFLFGDRSTGDPLTLNYWLQMWLAVYADLGAAVHEHPNAMIVPYEDLCADPRVWQSLTRALGTPAAAMTEIHSRDSRLVPDHDPALANRALALYDQLRTPALARLLA